MTASSPADFLKAATLLATDTVDELGPHAVMWTEVEDARARSAVSRAYYAAFRVLKARLCGARIEWRNNPASFPSRSVHALVLDALKAVLGEKDALYRDMKTLQRKRNTSDYEFEPALDCARADDGIIAASDAIDAITKLSNDVVEAIALELKNLAAT